MTIRVVRTWDQLTLGGGVVRFHSETIGTQPHIWECQDENCVTCVTYQQNKENNK